MLQTVRCRVADLRYDAILVPGKMGTALSMLAADPWGKELTKLLDAHDMQCEASGTASAALANLLNIRIIPQQALGDCS